MDETIADDYGRSWHAAVAGAVPPRPALGHDLDVDVCVIGAGLAGLTTALEVARLGWSVAVLEARRIAWNASSRNCGFVLPGYNCDEAVIVERVGLLRARQLWALSEAGVAYVRAVIEENALDGVSPGRGWLDVHTTDDLSELAETAALLRNEFGAAVETWPAGRVREVLRSESYFGALHVPGAFHVDPLAYALGLARVAEAAGVRIFEKTPAIEIDPAGVRKRIATPAALVRAGHVVLAGNVQIGGLMPELAATLMPITSTVVVTAPLGERLREAVAWPGAVSDSRFANYHYRVVDGDRLLWCGEGSCFTPNTAKVAESLRDAIARTYPQLGRPEIAAAWSGTMGFALHRMPQIGEVTPGLWLASGFGGHGLNTTALAGNLIAHAIVDGDDTWTAFEPWDLVWAGGLAGRVFQEVRGKIRNRRERVSAAMARRRARKRVAAGQPPVPDETLVRGEMPVAAGGAVAETPAKNTPPAGTAERSNEPEPAFGPALPSVSAEEVDSRRARTAEPSPEVAPAEPPADQAVVPVPDPGRPRRPVRRRGKRRNRPH
ncbi:FAD dependent oxidoreductase [Rhodovulum sp. PH10]|uniref:NAD(P)/FAD-dependent oxidoreductase n=1 Tax=Rhodovulum sp. PH10 TaxID=1187851 RepID=UPI00027C2BD2|nr:FAD-dependent oxidoreductase [Rhodovulum sp. PH10]EJW10038.1 FAD dependent oxidoreductase [Rhodovulum sp. PH10]